MRPCVLPLEVYAAIDRGAIRYSTAYRRWRAGWPLPLILCPQRVLTERLAPEVGRAIHQTRRGRESVIRGHNRKTRDEVASK